MCIIWLSRYQTFLSASFAGHLITCTCTNKETNKHIYYIDEDFVPQAWDRKLSSLGRQLPVKVVIKSGNRGQVHVQDEAKQTSLTFPVWQRQMSSSNVLEGSLSLWSDVWWLQLYRHTYIHRYSLKWQDNATLFSTWCVTIISIGGKSR